MVVMNFWWVRIDHFQISFLQDFFFNVKNIVLNEHVFKKFTWAFIYVDSMGFHFRISKEYLP